MIYKSINCKDSHNHLLPQGPLARCLLFFLKYQTDPALSRSSIRLVE